MKIEEQPALAQLSAPIFEEFTTSWYKSEKDTQPERRKAIWLNFIGLFQTPPSAACTTAACPSGTCPHKGGEAWSPAVLKPGSRRLSANVDHLSLFVIDIDHVSELELAKIEECLAPFRAIVHASHSDRSGDRCVRVILLPSRPISAAEYPPFRTAALALVGITSADPKAKDLSRIYFTPRPPQDAHYYFRRYTGAAINVDEVLATVPPTAAATHDQNQITTGLFHVPNQRPEIISTGFHAALESLDQGDILERISGTELVNRQEIAIATANSAGNRAVIIDGKTTGAFIDGDGRLAHANTGTAAAGPDGGPLVHTWLRHYGHKNEEVIQGLLQHVPEIAAACSPKPLQAELRQPAPYPTEALGPLLCAAVRALQAITQAPTALVAQALLAAASLAAQAHADVSINGQTRPISLWFITIAKSGERKSTADREALKAHRQRERELYADYVVAFDKFEQALRDFDDRTKKKSRDKSSAPSNAHFFDTKPTPPPEPLLLVNDPTLEGVQKLLASGVSSLGLFSDEGGMFFGGYSMGKEQAQRTIAGMAKLWDDGSTDRIRATDRSFKLWGRRMGMHVMLQPIIAGEVLSNRLLREQGFLARSLIAWPNSTVGTRLHQGPQPPRSAALLAYDARIADLLRHTPKFADGATQGSLEPPSLALSHEAMRIYVEYYNRIEVAQGRGQRYYDYIPWASKSAEQAVRMAGVITIVEHADPREIDARAMGYGVALAEYYLDELVRISEHAVLSSDTEAATKLLEWCHRKELSVVTKRDLRGGPCRDPKELAAALSCLAAHNWAIPCGSGRWLIRTPTTCDRATNATSGATSGDARED